MLGLASYNRQQVVIFLQVMHYFEINNRLFVMTSGLDSYGDEATCISGR